MLYMDRNNQKVKDIGAASRIVANAQDSLRRDAYRTRNQSEHKRIERGVLMLERILDHLGTQIRDDRSCWIER